MPTLVTNKGVQHEYSILETFEGGLALTGNEVKSLRGGNASLKGAFLTFRGDELFITNMHIGRYAPAGPNAQHDPLRARKVLVHKKELDRLRGKHLAERLTIVPLSVYTKKNFLKLGFALARGKRTHEKREAIKQRDLDRALRRGLE